VLLVIAPSSAESSQRVAHPLSSSALCQDALATDALRTRLLLLLLLP